jgi:AcrR family transcriptional regulator
MFSEIKRASKRRYEQRKRAEQQEQTRKRITEAAVELHGSVGPAHATVSAIAERAGVQRATVYRHFPDERSLFHACSSHYAASNPVPDPSPWWRIRDPERRLRTALDGLYGWYDTNEAMLFNVTRDYDSMPILKEVGAGRIAYLAALEDGLARGWGARGRRAQRLHAAIALSLDFGAWRTLARMRGLDRAATVEVMATMVTAVARPAPPTG